jgi:hypothetical protein
VHTLGAQNVNGRSQNKTDGFRAEVSHALRRTVWTARPAISTCFSVLFSIQFVKDKKILLNQIVVAQNRYMFWLYSVAETCGCFFSKISLTNWKYDTFVRFADIKLNIKEVCSGDPN